MARKSLGQNNNTGAVLVGLGLLVVLGLGQQREEQAAEEEGPEIEPGTGRRAQPQTPVVILQPRGTLSLVQGNTLRVFAQAWEGQRGRSREITQRITWHLTQRDRDIDLGTGTTEPDLPGFSVRRITFQNIGTFGIEARITNAAGQSARDRMVVQVQAAAQPSPGGGGGVSPAPSPGGAPVLVQNPTGTIRATAGARIRFEARVWETNQRQRNISQDVQWFITSGGRDTNIGPGLVGPSAVSTDQASVKNVTFASAGTFGVEARVTNSAGQSASSRTLVEVRAASPAGGGGLDPSPLPPDGSQPDRRAQELCRLMASLGTNPQVFIPPQMDRSTARRFLDAQQRKNYLHNLRNIVGVPEGQRPTDAQIREARSIQRQAFSEVVGIANRFERSDASLERVANAVLSGDTSGLSGLDLIMAAGPPAGVQTGIQSRAQLETTLACP